MLCSTLRVYSLFLMPLYPLASVVARLGGGGGRVGRAGLWEREFPSCGSLGSFDCCNP